MRRKSQFLLWLTLVAVMLLGGCYYRLTDRETGSVYYTSDQQARWSLGPGESVHFTDARTGEQKTLFYPKIEILSGKEYRAGLQNEAGR